MIVNKSTNTETGSDRRSLTLLHDVGPADLALPISPDLNSIVQSPVARRKVVQALAADPRARLTIAVGDGAIVGRAMVAPSFGRWQSLPRVREFGIEVARGWRRHGVATALMAAALADPAVEEEILLAFTLPAAWDTDSAGLCQRDYGRLLGALVGRAGFRPTGTDEPEVSLQHDAALLVRVGTRVPPVAVAAFERARYRGREAEHAPASDARPTLAGHSQAAAVETEVSDSVKSAHRETAKPGVTLTRPAG